MRDYRKLLAFQAADEFVLAVYAIVRIFPAHERFGLTLQLRRAAVSIAANIVEGCARETSADYARLIGIAYASACEAQYELDLAVKLGYVSGEASERVREAGAKTARLLSRLLAKVQLFRAQDASPRTSSPKLRTAG